MISFTRRRAVASCAAAVGILSVPHRGLALSLVDISKAGKALGDAADAVGKLADSIAHVVALGTKGWDEGSARATRARLKGVSAELSILVTDQRVRALDPLSLYIALWDRHTERGSRPLTSDQLLDLSFKWKVFREHTGGLLVRVRDILAAVRNDRSDFVLSPAFRDLNLALSGRRSILSSMQSWSAPVTPTQITGLRVVAANYERLHVNLNRAIDRLNAYIGTI